MSEQNKALFIRISPSLHKKLGEQAHIERRSVASLCEVLLTQGMAGRYEKGKVPLTDRLNRMVGEHGGWNG